MANVLYLTHRIPFPPDKGDKIATYNFLRHLCAHHRVYLGSFVDSPEDWAHVDKLKAMCAEVKLIGIHPQARRLFSAQALLLGQSLSQVYYRSRALQAWVDVVVPRAGIDSALAYSSAMAPYLGAPSCAGLRKVGHYTDVDSEKWATYAQTHKGLMAWVYAREGRTLLALEREMSQHCHVTGFISEAEVALYKRLAPEAASKVQVIPNGVDTDYFDPDLAYDNPFELGQRSIVFTGAMDYWPNVDAVQWFATEILGLIRAQLPQAQFCIVGSKPTKAVLALADIPGVSVTGRVPDVRPYLAHAGAVVAPLRVARGTQNKVLEAYAMARPVVLTAAAANGLIPAPFMADAIHDAPASMATAVVQALAAPARFEPARQYVMDRFSWNYAFSVLDQAMQIAQVSASAA